METERLTIEEMEFCRRGKCCPTISFVSKEGELQRVLIGDTETGVVTLSADQWADLAHNVRSGAYDQYIAD